LGLAAVFPTTFAIFTRQFGRQASQLTGFFFVLGGMGGALIPWLVGLTSAGLGIYASDFSFHCFAWRL
jgi:fucose permease